MGSEGKKKPPHRPEFSFPISMERGERAGLREPSELIGETRFVPMDALETDSSMTLELDLAGITPEEVSVTFQESWIVIEGTKRDVVEAREKAEFHISERSFGPFKRIFKVSAALDIDASSATYHLGVLRVVLPKLSDRRKRACRIAVKRAED